MFTDFFFLLRDKGVPVTITEWLTLMEALSKGAVTPDINHFYYIARSILIKNEAYYDHFDEAFLEYFAEVKAPEKIKDEVWEWLKNPANKIEIPKELIEEFKQMDLEELRKEFERRLKEQKERHDGGNKWIGTGGTSPFGHSGYHPGGIRVGGESMHRSASQVAAERRFRNYRHDIVLDTRQIKVALRKIRQFARIGPKDELNLDKTIEKTCKNAGELELVWERRRKNNVKLLLLMDVGGSMDPYAHLVNRLFSAAHSSTHFKEFKYYYFHNCIYEYLFVDMERKETIPTPYLFQNYGKEFRLIIVGDAAMHPWELLVPGGAIDYYHHNEEAGIEWLKRIREHFPYSVWLNPEPEIYWTSETTRIIRRIFPMYELTVEGIEESTKKLMSLSPVA